MSARARALASDLGFIKSDQPGVRMLTKHIRHLFGHQQCRLLSAPCSRQSEHASDGTPNPALVRRTPNLRQERGTHFWALKSGVLGVKPQKRPGSPSPNPTAHLAGVGKGITNMSRARSRGRHRGTSQARSRARTLVVAPALVAAVGGSIAMSQPASAATTWAGLRQCESGGNYSTNTGNGYYGAYQFSLSTWRSLGYTGLPSDASPATQDEAALKLAARSGFGQWPVCGLGMGSSQLASGASSSGAGTSGRTSGGRVNINSSRSIAASVPPRVVLSADTGSTSTGRPLLTVGLIYQVRSDVHSWQNQMNSLGYHIRVDGQYGPESAGAASRFQAAKGLTVDGICGPRTWAAVFG